MIDLYANTSFTLLNNFSLLHCGHAEITRNKIRINSTSHDLEKANPRDEIWSTASANYVLYPLYRIYLAVKGYAELVLTNNRILPLEAGKLYLIPPFSVKGARNHDYYRHYFLYFQIKKITYNLLEYYDIVTPIEAGEEEEKLFKTLLAHSASNSPKSELLTQSMFTSLLSRFFTEDSKIDPKVFRFRSILDYIENNISQNITIKELAKIANLNVNYFSNLFYSTFHMSPTKYIIEKKMDLACRLLSTTDMTISEISDYLGYNNQYYFNTVFKKVFSLPPGKWRNQRNIDL